MKKCGLVSLCDLVEYGISNSHARIILKELSDIGIIVTIGPIGRRVFGFSCDWFDKNYDGYKLDFCYRDILCVDVVCKTHGCGKIFEDYYKDGYYCRECIVGCSLVEDLDSVADWHYSRWGTKSCLGVD